MDKCLIEARVPAFEHGHTYVGLSRVHSREGCGAFVDAESCRTIRGVDCLVLCSITYPELLERVGLA